jgi:hypothetical protein
MVIDFFIRGKTWFALGIENFIRGKTWFWYGNRFSYQGLNVILILIKWLF